MNESIKKEQRAKEQIVLFTEKQCCGFRSGIQSLFDPWIRDGSTTRIRIRECGSRMNNPDHISESLEKIF
jgi:hypothetical protein